MYVWAPENVSQCYQEQGKKCIFQLKIPGE